VIETRYATRTGTWRTPAGREAVFAYRDSTNDWNTISACLTDNEYDLPRDLRGLALDIGAYLGAVTVALALDNPALRVYAIEPVPDNVRLLRENVERNDVADRVRVIHGAVGVGQVTVWHSFRGSESAEHHAFVGNSSLFAAPYSASYTEDIHTGWPLASLATEPIAFCKIDIEGGEFTVLADPAVSLCRVIVGEWHPAHGTQRDIRTLLSRTHDVTFSGPPEGPGGFRAVRRA
jgi:FkbM family methyltransferase